MRAVTGIAQRNAGARASVAVEPDALARVARGVGVPRAPSVRTVIALASKPTTTDPS
jgi:hypothetical protein